MYYSIEIAVLQFPDFATSGANTEVVEDGVSVSEN
jgi:hypothetical protein